MESGNTCQSKQPTHPSPPPSHLPASSPLLPNSHCQSASTAWQDANCSYKQKSISFLKIIFNNRISRDSLLAFRCLPPSSFTNKQVSVMCVHSPKQRHPGSEGFDINVGRASNPRLMSTQSLCQNIHAFHSYLPFKSKGYMGGV